MDSPLLKSMGPKHLLIDDPYLHIVNVFPLSKLVHVGEVNHPTVIKLNTPIINIDEELLNYTR